MSLSDSPTRAGARPRPAITFGRGDPLLRILVAIGIIGAVVAVAQAPAAITQLYRDADTATDLVVPQLASHLPRGATVNLGNHSFYEAWWFMRLTSGLPDHRAIWEIAPYVVAFLGIASIVWTAVAALGRTGGAIAAAILLAIGNDLRTIVFVPAARVGMLLHLGVLLGALLWQARRPEILFSRRRTIALGAAVTAFTAAGATDQLTLYETVGPFLVGAAVLCWRHRSPTTVRLLCWAVPVAVLSAGGAAILTRVMLDAGVSAANGVSSYQFVPTGEIGPSIGNLLSTWTALGNGDFFGAVIGRAALVTLVLGVMSLAGLIAALTLAWRAAAGWTRTPPPSPDRLRGAISEPAMRTLYLAFWGTELVLVLALDVMTTVWRAGSGRFLLGGWAAVAALLAAGAAGRRGRTVLAACVAVFAGIVAVQNVKDGIPQNPASYTPAQVAGISRFVLAHDAPVGYSGFWSANNFTFASRFRVPVYPVWKCNPTTVRLCYQAFANVSSAYVPRPHTNTFLITGPAVDVLTPVTAPPALGRPLASARFGEYAVTVYPRDIAASLGRM